MTYDNPKYGADRTTMIAFETDSNAAASTEQARFRNFVAMKVKEVRAVVVAAGTATTMGYNILKGTSSIGAVVCGTQGRVPWWMHP